MVYFFIWWKGRSCKSTEIRITGLYNILKKVYGPQGWWPLRSRRIHTGAVPRLTYGFNSGGYHPGINYKPEGCDIFEIAAGAVLTQNTNWSNAAKALDSLITAGSNVCRDGGGDSAAQTCPAYPP